MIAFQFLKIYLRKHSWIRMKCILKNYKLSEGHSYWFKSQESFHCHSAQPQGHNAEQNYDAPAQIKTYRKKLSTRFKKK